MSQDNMVHFHNGAFAVDDESLFATRGGWHVPLDRVAELDDAVSYAVQCAAFHPRVGLDYIEAAFRHAINRAGGDQPDWDATRLRMEAARVWWPLLAEGLRKAIAGES